MLHIANDCNQLYVIQTLVFDDVRRTASELSTNVRVVDGARPTVKSWQTWTCGCGCMHAWAHATMFALYLLALTIVFAAIRWVNVDYFELRSRGNTISCVRDLVVKVHITLIIAYITGFGACKLACPLHVWGGKGIIKHFCWYTYNIHIQ
jgi:hypothetical protein